MYPPVVMRLSLPRKKGGSFRLWLPLFLLWPVALALSIVLALLWLLAAIAWRLSGRGWGPLVIPWRVMVLICCLPGLLVDVRGCNGQTVRVGFW